MAIDKLQERIRKLKNPSAISFSIIPDLLPTRIALEVETSAKAAEGHFCELLEALSGVVPAVRFSLGSFSLYPDGTQVLANLLKKAKDLDFYVLLDGPEILSPAQAQHTCKLLCSENSPFVFDGIILSAFLGSDILKPFIATAAEGEKDVFAIIRTPNKSAAELQDLLTGSRLVHTAAADVVSRLGESILTRSGYSPVGALASATAPDSLRNLRAKYKYLFLLVDGFSCPGANAKNCCNAFDNLGHGALVCSDLSTVERDGGAEAVREYAERMRHNLSRYVSVF